jgi:hypothetical protein
MPDVVSACEGGNRRRNAPDLGIRAPLSSMVATDGRPMGTPFPELCKIAPLLKTVFANNQQFKRRTPAARPLRVRHP